MKPNSGSDTHIVSLLLKRNNTFHIVNYVINSDITLKDLIIFIYTTLLKSLKLLINPYNTNISVSIIHHLYDIAVVLFTILMYGAIHKHTHGLPSRWV